MSVDSVTLCRAALETALKNITPELNTLNPEKTTAWDNVQHVPGSGIPYQRATVLFAAPDNPVYGPGYQERGILQVTLYYPIQTGAGAAALRAALIRDTFKRGTSLVSGAVTVVIEKTPEIGAGTPDGDRWALPVKIRWYANVFN